MANWKFSLAVRDIINSDKPFIEIRDEIVTRIKKSAFYSRYNNDEELQEIVEGIALSDNENEFDNYWDSFYDWCNYYRIWWK